MGEHSDRYMYQVSLACWDLWTSRVMVLRQVGTTEITEF